MNNHYNAKTFSKHRLTGMNVPDDAEEVIDICCKAIGLSRKTVVAGYKGGMRSNFKNLVRWALYNHCGLDKSKVGKLLHHKRTTVVNGLIAFEDKLEEMKVIDKIK